MRWIDYAAKLPTPIMACVVSSSLAVMGVHAQVPSSSELGQDAVSPELAFVKAIDDILIPAEAAGKIISMPVREGDMVTEGQELARINDVEAELNYKVAFHEHAAAKKEAESDVKVRAAKAADEVKQAEWDMALDANKKTPNAVTLMEVKRLELDAKHAKLQTEQSEVQFDIAGITAEVQEGKMELAVHEYKKRQIKSPFTGMVVKYEKHFGEWVNLGEPVMRLLRLDRLYVIRQVDVDEYAPHTMLNRDVEIHVSVGGKKESVRAKIAYVEPVIQADGRYTIRAEIENRQAGANWILYPGMRAEMTILGP